MVERRLFAIVPAAGWSRRMGQPKLLLPLGGQTVLARLLAVLDRPEIFCRTVVCRKDDDALLAEIQAAGVWAIQPDEDPPDMRTSVERALAAIEERYAPDRRDGWLLVPGDHPVLSAAVIDRLIAEWQQTSAGIVIPTCAGTRGHPTVFSWRLAAAVPHIPLDCGLNWLVRAREAEVCEVVVEDRAIFTDLDTPADYAALKNSLNVPPPSPDPES